MFGNLTSESYEILYFMLYINMPFRKLLPNANSLVFVQSFLLNLFIVYIKLQTE